MTGTDQFSGDASKHDHYDHLVFTAVAVVRRRNTGLSTRERCASPGLHSQDNDPGQATEPSWAYMSFTKKWG